MKAEQRPIGEKPMWQAEFGAETVISRAHNPDRQILFLFVGYGPRKVRGPQRRYGSSNPQKPSTGTF
jgi:hypothetical protein